MSGVLALLSTAAGNAFSVAASSVSKTDSGFAASGTVTTSETPGTTPTGGTAPYTYAWTKFSGSSVPAVSDATAQNPTWSGTVNSEVEEVAVWRVMVTDDAGAIAFRNITVTLRWFNLF